MVRAADTAAINREVVGIGDRGHRHPPCEACLKCLERKDEIWAMCFGPAGAFLPTSLIVVSILLPTAHIAKLEIHVCSLHLCYQSQLTPPVAILSSTE
jgi:hypothetical protein